MDCKTLKDRVAKDGGIRLASHGSMRDQIVDLVVSEWPKECPREQLTEVLHARVSMIVRSGRPSMYSLFIIHMMVRPIVRICVDWYFEKSAHMILMEGWRAKKAQDL